MKYLVYETEPGNWCGQRVGPSGNPLFTTSGWPTAETAKKRLEEHRAEVESAGGTIRYMSPLSVFRKENGLELDSNGKVFVVPDDAIDLDAVETE